MRPVDDQVPVAPEMRHDLLLVDVGRESAHEDLAREPLLVELVHLVELLLLLERQVHHVGVEGRLAERVLRLLLRLWLLLRVVRVEVGRLVLHGVVGVEVAVRAVEAVGLHLGLGEQVVVVDGGARRVAVLLLGVEAVGWVGQVGRGGGSGRGGCGGRQVRRHGLVELLELFEEVGVVRARVGVVELVELFEFEELLELRRVLLEDVEELRVEQRVLEG